MPDLDLQAGGSLTFDFSPFAEVEFKVNFLTNLGNFPVVLRNDVAPGTVTNFLAYVARGDYQSIFVHRAIPNFVVQSGGYTIVGEGDDWEVFNVEQAPPIPSEASLPNLRGTLAMALVGGNPDSGTSQWYFNLVDNLFLDDPANGPFTVFGEVIEDGMEVVDALGNTPAFSFGGNIFTDVPLINYIGAGPTAIENFIVISGIEVVTGPQLVSVAPGNPGVFTANVRGAELIVEAPPGASGSGTITLLVPVNGEMVKTSFAVRVSPPPSINLPGFGELLVVGENLYLSSQFGTLILADDANNTSLAWATSLGSWLSVSGEQVQSAEFGKLSATAEAGWVESEYFGWVHFGADFNQYQGWVWSQRFGWMRFVQSGNQNMLWANDLKTWMSVNSDGSFSTFDFGRLTPIGGLNRYHSNLIGNFTTGDFGGWVASDRFGFVWAARGTNGVWFYSTDRQDWIGVVAPGMIWSTKEGRFLE